MKTKPKTLVGELREKLRSQVLSGAYQPGDRLPSEAKLTAEHKVSRTVVREAIASLRADGLVDARQGAGVFVAEPKYPSSFGYSFSPEKLSSMIELTELRIAVEVEAAGLAAVRRSPQQEEKIIECLNQLNIHEKNGVVRFDLDLELHVAIAEATNNKRFEEFLHMLGDKILPIPMISVDSPEVKECERRDWAQEHRAIVDAISARDEQGARDAMRHHLQEGQLRYRALLSRRSSDETA